MILCRWRYLQVPRSLRGESRLCTWNDSVVIMVQEPLLYVHDPVALQFIVSKVSDLRV